MVAWGLSIPIHNSVTDEDQKAITSACRFFAFSSSTSFVIARDSSTFPSAPTKIKKTHFKTESIDGVGGHSWTDETAKSKRFPQKLQNYIPSVSLSASNFPIFSFRV